MEMRENWPRRSCISGKAALYTWLTLSGNEEKGIMVYTAMMHWWMTNSMMEVGAATRWCNPHAQSLNTISVEICLVVAKLDMSCRTYKACGGSCYIALMWGQTTSGTNIKRSEGTSLETLLELVCLCVCVCFFNKCVLGEGVFSRRFELAGFCRV